MNTARYGTRGAVSWILLLLLSLAACLGEAEAQRRRGGGGGGGNLPPRMRADGNQQGRRDMMEALRLFPVAQIWAALSLGMELDTEKLDAIRLKLVEAYTFRQALLKEAREDDTWAYTKGQLLKAERELWSDLSKVLTRRERRKVELATRVR